MAKKSFIAGTPRKGALAEWVGLNGSFTIQEPCKLTIEKTKDEDGRAFPLKKNLKPGASQKRYHLCNDPEHPDFRVNIIDGAFEELDAREPSLKVLEVDVDGKSTINEKLMYYHDSLGTLQAQID